MARPSKLIKPVHDFIVSALRSGGTLEAAAQHCHVNPGTVRKWIALGEKIEQHLAEHPENGLADTEQIEGVAEPVDVIRHPEPDQERYRAFHAAVWRARVATYLGAETVVRTNNPQWWLQASPEARAVAEHLGRKPWRRIEAVEHSGPDGGPIVTEATAREMVLARIEAMAKRLGQEEA